MAERETAGEHTAIWLQPWCGDCEKRACQGYDEGRQWCEDDVWGKCEDCEEMSARYVLAKGETP